MIRCLAASTLQASRLRAASHDALQVEAVLRSLHDRLITLQPSSFKTADVANTTTAFCTNYVPCNDSPLSMSANIAGLITPTIAICAALRLYVSSYKNSLEVVIQLSSSLSASYNECRDTYSACEAYLENTSAEQEDDLAHKRAEAVQEAAHDVSIQLKRLQ